jgi:hypothetical protein
MRRCNVSVALRFLTPSVGGCIFPFSFHLETSAVAYFSQEVAGPLHEVPHNATAIERNTNTTRSLTPTQDPTDCQRPFGGPSCLESFNSFEVLTSVPVLIQLPHLVSLIPSL